MNKQEAIEALQNVSGKNQRLKKADFDFRPDTAGTESKIASYEAEVPLALLEDKDIRLVLVTHESFTTDGSGNQQTFELSADLMDTINTTNLVLFADGDRVRADDVRVDADEVDYTDGGAAEDLDVFYVARDPVEITIKKSAPSAGTDISQRVFDAPTSMLHERNQHKKAPEFDFDEDEDLAPIVPSEWTIDIYADGPIALDQEAGDVEGVNALLSLPVRRSSETIEGLSSAVKQDLIE